MSLLGDLNEFGDLKEKLEEEAEQLFDVVSSSSSFTNTTGS